MRYRIPILLAGVVLFASAGLSYIYNLSNSGVPVKRPDFANVQFSLNQNFAPGFTNNDGLVVITPDSDVTGALAAAIATWNSIPTTAAQFAPVLTTAQTSGQNLILMSDTAAVRSMVGPTLTALTLLFVSGTTVINSEVILNPVLTFSTTGAAETYDLQSVLTKQLGNALGPANSAIVGSSLWLTSSAGSSTKSTLSPDDIAAISALYPSASFASSYGTIGGTLTLNGSPLRNALVTIVDTGSGTALAATTRPDGSWSQAAPPGNYLVFAQPLLSVNVLLGQAMAAEYLGLFTSSAIDTNFLPGFLGGNGNGVTVSVNAGSASDASFSPAPSDGSNQPSLLTINAVSTGGAGPSTLSLTPSPTTVISGQAVDFLLMAQGLDSPLTDTNIQLFGPLALRPGSEKSAPGVNLNDVNYTGARFTVDVPPVTSQTYGSLIITNSSGTFVSYAGGIVILPPQ